jgi:hypothetical protein
MNNVTNATFDSNDTTTKDSGLACWDCVSGSGFLKVISLLVLPKLGDRSSTVMIILGLLKPAAAAYNYFSLFLKQPRRPPL